MLSLLDIGLYQQLSKRTTQNAIKYSGILIPIASDMDFLLQFIKKEFSTYPDHGIQHSFRILNYLSVLLSDSIQKNLSDTELFCLIMAALFHDTGMALYDQTDQIQLRDKHNEFSTKVLDKYFDEHLKLINHRDRLKPVISFVCYAHGLNIQELYKDDCFNKKDRIEFDEVKYSLLSILLRIGDLMDIEECRTNDFVLSCFSSNYSVEAFNHNIRNKKVQTYNYSPNELVIEVLAEDVDQYKIWSTWLSYLNNEILHANTYLQKYAVIFPAPNTKVNKASGTNFDVEELRFEIDDNGKIWQLLSQSIYTDEFDFIRELIQNSIDASLLRLYLDLSIPMDSISPRSWNINDNCDNVFIGFSEKRKELIIIDSGIGMNNLDLKKFLFKVTGSGYSGFDKRKFEFPSIAKFGIGFVSCLINANNIEIFTKKQEDDFIHQVSLAANSNLAVIQNLTISSFHGTAIRLKLKDDFVYSKIKTYLRNTFIYPSIGIIYVDLDSFENVYNTIATNPEFNSLLNETYLLKDQFYSIDIKRKKLISPITAKINALTNITDELSNLEYWIKDNMESDEKYSDVKKFDQFKKLIRNIIVLIKDSGLELPFFALNEKNISERNLFTSTETYINIIMQYFNNLENLIVQYRKQQSFYNYSYEEIKNSKVTMGFEWKYCIMLLNNDLEIWDIAYTNNPINLSSETGIILLNHEYCNSDEGCEYSAINGFLFSKGEICSSLSKISGYSEIPISREKHKRNYIIRGVYDDFDIEDELQSTYWDEYEESDVEFGTVRFDTRYYAIFCRNNKFLFSNELDYSETRNMDYSNRDRLIESIYDDSYDLFDRITKILYNQSHLAEKVSDIDIIMHNDAFVFCQDGIKFNTNLWGLFPLGVFKLYCNCTANSRMNLNVTRHKFSEIRSDIDAWTKKTGLLIQKSIINNVVNLLSDVSLNIDIEKLICEEKLMDDAISKACIDQFRMVCKEKSFK